MRIRNIDNSLMVTQTGVSRGTIRPAPGTNCGVAYHDHRQGHPAQNAGLRLQEEAKWQ